MKSVLKLCATALIVAGFAADVSAGCGRLRRGGCSDPCTAQACTGVAYHRGSCGGCSSMSGVVSSGCGGALHAGDASSGSCGGCGSAGSSCSGGSACGSVTTYSHPAIAAATIAREDLIDCGPVASYQVVMQSEYATETRAVPYTEYRDEIRYRTRTVSRQVPVEVQDYQVKTVMVPTTETKTVEYSVLVPVQEEKQIEVTESVPVWNEVEESYTVRVPTVVDVPEEYTVRVPQLRDETFTYTVQVPQTQTSQRVQRVTNAVPVAKTRTVQVCRPLTRMQTVTRDLGRWEIRVEEVAASAAPCASPASSGSISIGGCGTGTTYQSNSGCGGCGNANYSHNACGGCNQGCGQVVSSPCSSGCGGGCNSGCAQAVSTPCSSGCGSVAVGSISGVSSVSVGCGCGQAAQTVTRRVWVPNVVTEEVPVTESVNETQTITYTAFEQQTTEVPYECTTVVYVPEQRTGTRKVVDYVNETRTKTRKEVQYNSETRTRTRKELSYKQETRTQTVPHVSYTTEKRTKEVSFTVQVPQTEAVPVTSVRYETVQEEISEEYTVRVPYCAYREEQVQVCRMVPKLVPVTIYPCQANASAGSVSYGSSAGCGGCGQTSSGCTGCGSPTPAPVQPACGCGK